MEPMAKTKTTEKKLENPYLAGRYILWKNIVFSEVYFFLNILFLIFNHDFIPLLYHIQLVHLLSLPAMSANLHLLCPMHVSRQKVGFGGGG